MFTSPLRAYWICGTMALDRSRFADDRLHLRAIRVSTGARQSLRELSDDVIEIRATLLQERRAWRAANHAERERVRAHAAGLRALLLDFRFSKARFLEERPEQRRIVHFE